MALSAGDILARDGVLAHQVSIPIIAHSREKCKHLFIGSWSTITEQIHIVKKSLDTGRRCG